MLVQASSGGTYPATSLPGVGLLWLSESQVVVAGDGSGGTGHGLQHPHLAVGEFPTESRFSSLLSYMPMTIENIEVKEGDGTEVDFPLQPTVVSPGPDPTQLAATSAPAVVTNTTSPVQAETPTSPHQPVQPVDFRHHHFPDMEIFLRRYANEYPNITRLYSVGKSAEFRELYVMEISDNPGIHEAGKPSPAVGCLAPLELGARRQFLYLGTWLQGRIARLAEGLPRWH